MTFDKQNLHFRSTAVALDGSPKPAVVTVNVSGSHPRIAALSEVVPGDVAVVDVGDAIVVPAPLDVHLHGAGGHVVPPQSSPADIDAALRRATDAAGRHHAACPAPAYEWIATLPVPGDTAGSLVDDVARAARVVAKHRSTGASTGCRGLRLEGGFLNPSRAGVWPPDAFVTPTIELLGLLDDAVRAEGERLLIVDLAPELLEPDACAAFIAAARERDIVIAFAHTDADFDHTMHAIDAGATLATHTWNAMRPTLHRDPGVIAAVLSDGRVTCELICDGVHLHPGTIALSAAACGRGRWCVVSDASPFAGCEPGPYDWAGTRVHHDGTALRDDNERLAGSASLTWRALDVCHDARIAAFETALAMGAVPRQVLDPARTLGCEVGDYVWILPVVGSDG